MVGRMRSIRQRILVLAVAAIGVVAIGGSALAAQLAGEVKTFTGCLSSGDGVIVKVKEGDAPKSPCSGGQTLARISGGDITKVSVTGALTGGGDNGDISIGLKPEFSLPQGCSSGRVAKWNGSAWVCGIDNDTTYGAGTGLVETPAGPQDTDDVFSIHPDYRVKNTSDCSSGEFATGFLTTGVIQCDAPPTGAGFFSRLAGGEEIAGTETVLSKNLPAGNYLLFAHVVGGTPSFDDPAEGYCDLAGDRSSLGLSDDPLERFNNDMTLLSGIVHSGGVVALTCTETSGNFDVESASLAAIKLDSIG
jgi:hypothetical protein